MKTYISTILATAFLAAAAPAFAGTEVKAEPGITLTESAQAKFNRDTRPDDRQVKPVAGNSEPSRQFYASAGLTVAEGRALSLDEVFVAKINRENGRDGEQLAAADASVTMASRAYGQGGDHGQLVASARVNSADAVGMNLTEIAAAKFAVESGDD